MSREKFNRMNKASIHWEELIEGIQALSDEYEESGWRTLILHPGDVSTMASEVNDKKVGFRLIIPESELNTLAEMVSGNKESYNEFEVHGAPADDLLLFVVVVKSATREEAIIFPVYYDPDADRDFVKMVDEQDTIHTDITNLTQSQQFSFSHKNPTPFLP